MLNRFFLILTSLMMVSCSDNFLINEKKVISRSELERKAIDKASSILLRDKKLHAIGTGGCGHDKIKMLALSFNFYEPLDEAQARELLLTASDVFLAAINEDEKMHAHLYNVPFDHNNIEIRIFLFNSKGNNTKAGELSIIKAQDGFLTYKIDDSENKFGFHTLLKESYEDALQKRVGNL